MNRFPATSWDLNRADLAAILERAAVLDMGMIPTASNYVFLLALDDPDAGPGYAIYKPRKGEAPLWDFPPGLDQREVATYRVSEALGWRLVPPTVRRTEGLPHGVGSVQAYVPADHHCTFFELRDAHADAMRRMALFDWLTNNADRKGGHVLLGPGGQIWGVDNGLAFHVDEKLRTVIWDYAGEPVPAALLNDVAAFADAFTPDSALWRDLAAYLAADELAMLGRRAAAILEAGHYPPPPEDRRPYPWPVI